MKLMMIKEKPAPSEFKNLNGIEYFDFEEDFMEDNIRCIPMTVRLKMDTAGIKLKLSEWSKFYPAERIELALLPVNTHLETKIYHSYLCALIKIHTGNEATLLAIDPHPAFKNLTAIPLMLQKKTQETNLSISIRQWQNLSLMQRFALLKLCRPGHESKNFAKAVLEFGLLKI